MENNIEKKLEECAEYEKLRQEIEDSCRAQLQDEVRKRKEIEEKYNETWAELQKANEKLETVHGYMRRVATANRELAGCKMSFLQYLNTGRIFRNKDKFYVDKGMEFWGYVFDPVYYAKNNPDVVEQVGEDPQALLKHFVELGIYQSRQGSADFDIDRYLKFNEDVANSYMGDIREVYIHYVMYGKDENRRK